MSFDSCVPVRTPGECSRVLVDGGERNFLSGVHPLAIHKRLWGGPCRQHSPLWGSLGLLHFQPARPFMTHRQIATAEFPSSRPILLPS